MSLYSRISAILFVSGFCSLVYQVAWLRLLRLIFGASTASTAVVLAIFMGGLGIGGIVLGRRVHRVVNPLRFYAYLETGIAASAAATPLLVDLARSLYLGLGGVSSLGMTLATVVRVGLSILVLGLPTFLMGGTLPAVALAMEREADKGRRRMAWLYGLNTMGAVLGAFVTTFWAMEIFGVSRSLWLSALVNALLAMTVWRLARQTAGEAVERSPEPVEPDRPAQEGKSEGATGYRLVLAVAGSVGFLFFLMEIVWYRMLAPVLGGSSYTFGLILAVALLGIGAGGALYSAGPEDRRPTLASLAGTCALEGLLLAVPFAVGDPLALGAAVLHQLSVTGFIGLAFGWTLVTGLIVFPTAAVAGYQFPLLVALLGSGRERVGAQVGLAYGWNTAGAILGSLAGGLGLLPLLTAPRLWRLSGLAFAAMALLLVLLDSLRSSSRPGWRALAPAGTALLCIALSMTPGPSAFWRHSPIGAGRVSLSAIDGPNSWQDQLNRDRRAVVEEFEGVESSVALLRYLDLVLKVNGKSDGSGRGDSANFVMSGLIGAALHSEPRRVLVIGLGTGTTAGWLAKAESVERIDVVELEPAIVELARYYEPVNLAVLDSPKIHLRIGDGREFARTTDETYDLIFSQPSNPYRAGVADLFSEELYRSMVDRLAPNGVFLQWLQGYEVDADVVLTALATLSSVFSDVETWQTTPSDLLLVAGRRPVRHDLSALRRRLAETPYREALRLVWGVEGAEGLYTGFVGDARLTRALADRGEVSTDDRPVLEYLFVRNLGRKGLFDLADLHRISRRLGTHHPGILGGIVDWDLVEELRIARAAHDAFHFPLPPAAPDKAARYRARRAYLAGDLRTTGREWLLQDAGPFCHLDRLLVAEALAELGETAATASLAEQALADLRRQAPTEAAFIEARLSWRRGAADRAVGELAEAFVRFRDDAWVFLPMVRRSFDLLREMMNSDPRHVERLFAALDRPFPILLFEDLRLLTRYQLVSVHGFDRHCTEVFEAFEPHVIWVEPFLDARARCYAESSHPLHELAATQLQTFRSRASPHLM